MAYPGIYRAKAASINGTRLQAFIPQVFGDVPVTVENFVGDIPATASMGWVSFQGGNPEFPVWHGAGGGGGGSGTVTDVMWVGPEAPTAPDIELWWDTDEPPAGGGGEEVYIGAEPPGAGYELWYDTDAEAPLTLEQRWNTAWGVVTTVRTGTQTTAGINSIPADTGLAVTWGAVAGRRYRVSVLCSRVNTAASSLLDVLWTDGANVVQDYLMVNQAVNGQLQVDGWTYASASITGSMTYKVRAAATAGFSAPVFQYGTHPSTLMVEDVGPVQQGTTPPQPSNVLTPWTPTVTGLTKGSGTQEAWYLKYGQVCHLTYRFLFGAGSAMTGSALQVSLPFTSLGWGANGGGYTFDASTPANSAYIIVTLSSKDLLTVNTLGYGANESNFRNITATIPFPWSATSTGGYFDEFAFEMTYLTAT